MRREMMDAKLILFSCLLVLSSARVTKANVFKSIKVTKDNFMSYMHLFHSRHDFCLLVCMKMRLSLSPSLGFKLMALSLSLFPFYLLYLAFKLIDRLTLPLSSDLEDTQNKISLHKINYGSTNL